MSGQAVTTYAIFAGQDYYPQGGMNDLKRAFSAADDAAAVSIVENDLPDKNEEWIDLAAFEDGRAREVGHWRRRSIIEGDRLAYEAWERRL